MTDAWNATPPFRPDAVRFDVRNSAGIAYFYDEDHRRTLKKSALGKHGSDASPKTIANLGKKKLFAEFTVTRGVPLLGFAALGPPPDAAELTGDNWQSARMALLSLPSGQLRVETADSFSVGPDLPDEPGLFFEVPPGEYTLTLVERGDSSGSDLPRLLVTLTPDAETLVPAGFQLTARPAEPPPLPLAKYTAYTITDGTFHGLLAPDGVCTNFDARAAEALGLHFGTPIRLTVGKCDVDAYFIGDARLADLQQLADPALRTEGPLVSQWMAWADLRPEGVHFLKRWSGEVHRWPPAPKNRWQPLTVARSPRPPLALGPLDPGAGVVDGNTLRGQVLTCSPLVLTVNVGRDGLAAIGAQPRDATGATDLFLTVGGVTHPLTVYHDRAFFGGRRFNLYCQMGENAIAAYRALKRNYDVPDDPDAIIAAVGEAAIRQLALGPLLQRMRELGPVRALQLEPQPFPRPLALLGATIPHWSAPARDVLWIEATAYLRDEKWHAMQDKNPAPHEIAAAAGDAVTLRKA